MSLLRFPVPRYFNCPRTRRTTSINRPHVPHKASTIGGGGGIRGRVRGINPAVVEVDCAVVLTVSTELTAPPFEGVNAAGLARHNAPLGKVPQLMDTAWLKLLMGDTVTV